MPSLQHIVRLVLDICLLRRGPQDLPASPTLLAATMLASAVVGYPTMRALPAATATPGLDAAYGVIVTFAFTYALLHAYGLGNRFLQTATALYATDVVVTGLALILLTLGSAGTPVTALGLIGLILWNIAIIAHIFRHALDTVIALATVWALALVIGSGLLLEWLHA
ncbi:hypothetical protein KBTX_02055 [wastewater metagenome]|uniref:Yip1 domain-containing protein n=2 Tax=unclassified sequences TaxID=12908 RepID=A0A5B8RAV0_9ZZZZ|nr:MULTISPECIES: hypothetical protein [Arhodomonas]QEA05731.1 hypothetical protein KBTEX_02055 [uncultured organism]